MLHVIRGRNPGIKLKRFSTSFDDHSGKWGMYAEAKGYWVNCHAVRLPELDNEEGTERKNVYRNVAGETWEVQGHCTISKIVPQSAGDYYDTSITIGGKTRSLSYWLYKTRTRR